MSELMRKEFPADSEVVLRQSAAGLTVIVRTRRPNPEWLARQREPGEHWCKVTDAELEEAMLAAVEKDSGKGPTYYTRLTVAQGGVGGSQERKEKVFGRLLREGKLRLEPLAKPVGRRALGVFPAM